jgi:hypothetical protein
MFSIEKHYELLSSFINLVMQSDRLDHGDRLLGGFEKGTTYAWINI